jgi:chitinase
MKTLRLALYVIAILFVALPAMGQQRQIIGYYPSWKWDKRNNLVNTKVIPYEKLTIINYAFLIPRSDGGIVGVDTLSEAEDHILNGDRDNGMGGHIAGTSLAARAHRHGVKTMVSVGGWEGSLEFSQIAADPKTRSNFAHSCICQIIDYGFDGIDIDWEFPCYVEHKGIPADKQNFTLLLQEVRDSLTAHGKRTGVSYLLTAALPGGGSNAENMEIDKIAPILDFLNIMTYDFYGDWSPVSGHNAPLYAGRPEDSTLSVDASFRLYHEKYGIPAQKINLGAPFYGHTFKNCTGLYAKHDGTDRDHFPDDGFFYHDVLQHRDKFTRYWDEKAKVPYLLGKNFDTFVSYDDEESIRLKAEYVVEKNAAGLIIWEITADFLPDRTTPLLDVINATFQKTK